MLSYYSADSCEVCIIPRSTSPVCWWVGYQWYHWHDTCTVIGKRGANDNKLLCQEISPKVKNNCKWHHITSVTGSLTVTAPTSTVPYHRFHACQRTAHWVMIPGESIPVDCWKLPFSGLAPFPRRLYTRHSMSPFSCQILIPFKTRNVSMPLW